MQTDAFKNYCQNSQNKTKGIEEMQYVIKDCYYFTSVSS